MLKSNEAAPIEYLNLAKLNVTFSDIAFGLAGAPAGAVGGDDDLLQLELHDERRHPGRQREVERHRLEVLAGRNALDERDAVGVDQLGDRHVLNVRLPGPDASADLRAAAVR
jgi:hypothetical protein